MKRPILIFTVAFIIAIVGAQYFNISICSPFNLEKKYATVSNCQVIGTIVGEQKETEYFYKYIFKVEELYKNSIKISELKNTKILLKIKKDTSNLEIGNQLIINCNLEIPDGERNYGGYSYKMYLKTLGIYAISEIENIDYKVIQDNNLSIIDSGIYKIKTKITDNLNKVLSNETKGIALGILLGDITCVSDDVKEDFKNSNLLHMLAVSGSHVTYILIGAQKCLKNVDKRFQKWILILFLLFFIKLTGETPSVIRAGIMGILIIASWICRRKSDVLNNIAISCFVILLINPYSIYNLGFILSYAGTLGIIFYYDCIYALITKKVHFLIDISQGIPLLNKLIKYLITTTSVSIAANILIMPIMIYYFNNISFVFLISNILVSSLFTIILFLTFAITIISFLSINLASFISPILEILVNVLNYQTALSAKLAVFDVIIPTPSIITIIVVYVIIFLMKNTIISKKHSKKIIKFLVIGYIIISIIFVTVKNFKQEMKLYFIDVGQGDSTLIITEHNKKILIDGGGSNTEFDVGEQTLLPYLLDRKIICLDFIIISHFDSDHCRGVFTVLRKLDVKNVCISAHGQESENYNEFIKIANEKKLNVIFVNKGDKIKIDKHTYLHILWTGDDSISENIINNYSITCKIVYRDYKILFTGDIESVAEEKIINLYSDGELKSNILKIAHHGSKSSSTEKFIKLVSPEIALIGVGKDNTFGHPNDGVINRLENIGTQIFRTDWNGEIVITIGKKIKIDKCIN